MDPSRQEMNPYQYSMSNPVMHTDPSGLCTMGIDCTVGDGGSSHPSESLPSNPPSGSQHPSYSLPSNECGSQESQDFWAGFVDQLLWDMAWNGVLLEVTGAVTDTYAEMAKLSDAGAAYMQTAYSTGSNDYRMGREAGRTASQIIATSEAVLGGIAFLGSITITSTTITLEGLFCGAAGVGVAPAAVPCTIGVPVVAAAGATTLTAATITAHGAGMLYFSSNNPVGSEQSGGSNAGRGFVDRVRNNSRHDLNKTLKTHSSGGADVARAKRRGREYHIFNDDVDLERLEQLVWDNGTYTGEIRDWHRIYYETDEIIGYRYQAGRDPIPLKGVEIKGHFLDDGIFEYHLVPRTRVAR